MGLGSDFLVVHNGIITNYNDVKGYLTKKGYTFESETDTEVIAKLIQHLHDRYPKFSFRQLVEITIQQLVGGGEGECWVGKGFTNLHF